MSQPNYKYKRLESLLSRAKPPDPNPASRVVQGEVDGLKARIAFLEAQLEENRRKQQRLGQTMVKPASESKTQGKLFETGVMPRADSLAVHPEPPGTNRGLLDPPLRTKLMFGFVSVLVLASLSGAFSIMQKSKSTPMSVVALLTTTSTPTKADLLPTATSTLINLTSTTYFVSPTATSSSTPIIGLKDYYVSLTGNNTDGRSWDTAWNGLNQINWNIVQPGDTIYISGGTTGATYNGGLRISKSGTASEYITIDTGANSPSPAGHNGTVIIEGGSQCFLIKGSYVKLRNIVCQHATDDGIRIEGTGMILENNTVRETYGQGIHVHYCADCIVRGNRISTFPNDGPDENRPYQTDGIVIYESSDTLIERNWIRLTNQYGPAHIDGIQSSTNLGKSNKNITIRYNYVENTKAAISNSQGIYLTQMQGDVKVIGNIVLVPIGGQAVASHLFNNSPVNVYVIANTIKNGGYWNLRVEDDDPVIKNNILWQTCGGTPYISNGSLIKMESSWAGNIANINNNIYYRPCASGTDFYAPNGTNWSSWQSKGFDTNGIYGQNPDLDNCLRPSNASSPSVGKGAILADEYNQGLSPSLCGQNGPDAFLPVILHSRNQYGGTSWDIGAYEH